VHTLEKPKSRKIPKSEKISRDISLSGNYKQIQKAKELLKPLLATLPTVQESEVPVLLSKAIDEYQISASIMFRGHIIWSRRRIITNLDKIIEAKQLFRSTKKVRWIKVKEGYLPEVPKDFRPILDDYFYDFLVQVCGSNPHYNKAGWIGIYPTLEDLKRFFRENEQGVPVSKYIPAWKTDAERIVKDIETKLFPFRSYIKARQTKLEDIP
jgi:hypothetical protein